jgi:hypothetical protein
MNIKIIIPIIFLFFSFGLSAQDNPEGPLFPMGLPDEPDVLYETFDVKASLTNDNYRNVGSAASVKQWAPTPKSQGQLGTCAAWATGFCARTILEAKRYGWTDKAEIDKNVFAYGFIYRVTSSSPTCWGAFTSECVKNMRDIGIPKLTDYSIHCPSTVIPKEIYNIAARYKIKGYAKLWDEWSNTSNKRKVDLMKKSLSEGNPVVISMICPNSFHYPTGDVWTPKESATDNPNNPHGRHAMCVVGYDDDKHGGAFEIQNSWGPSWGNKGYIWVKYEDYANFVYQAMELLQFENINVNSEVSLSGAVRYVRDDKMEMKANLLSNKTYRMDRPYKSGTRFRLFISNNEPAFVYAFGSDLTNKTYQVFPYAPNISPALTYKRNEVAIPSEDKHVRMDGTVGTDYLCVLYSKDPIDLESVRKKIEGYGSRYNFKQKVQMAMGESLMKDSEVNFTKNAGKISFEAKAKGKSCVALIVEMEHID